LESLYRELVEMRPELRTSHHSPRDIASYVEETTGSYDEVITYSARHFPRKRLQQITFDVRARHIYMMQILF
jgi:hypothetical protein